MRRIGLKKIIILLLFLVPFSVKASTASIRSASISGMDTVSVGTEFSEDFKINFSNIKKGTTDTLGIWIIVFELEYDEDIFTVENISTDGGVWNSTIYKEGNKTYVLSEFNKDPYHNSCVDSTLYCADYIVSIKFYVKNTDKTSSIIKMKDIGAGVFQVSGDSDVEYDTDDMIELEYSSQASKSININKTENVEINEPKSIISSSKPNIQKPEVSSNAIKSNSVSKTENKKSSNNTLKSLEIINYDIDFSNVDNAKCKIVITEK